MVDRSVSRLIAWSFALAPIVLLLTTWGENLSPLQKWIRTLGLPILCIEIAVIATTALSGIKLQRPPKWIVITALALTILAWGTALTADFAPASVLRTTLWTIHLLFGLAIANLVGGGLIDADDFPPAIVSGFALFTFLMSVFVISNYRPDYDWIEDIPAYSNIRWYGYYASAVVGLSASGFARGRKGYFFVSVLALAAAIWTGSRGTVFAVIIGYAVAMVIFPLAREGWQRFAYALAAGIVLSAVLTWIGPIGPGVQRFSSIENGRLDLWLATLPMIELRPIFGWGEGQFGFMRAAGEVVHPHNVVIQVLLAWGAAGLFLVGALVVWLALKVIRAKAALPITLALCNIFAFSLVDGSLYHVQSVAMCSLCLALATARPSPPVQTPSPLRLNTVGISQTLSGL